MTDKTIIEKYLEDNQDARERKHNNYAICSIIKERFDLFDIISTDGLVSICKLYSTLDRTWRKILSEREDLRGSDYNDKEMLEQEKINELGYMVGVAQDIKKLNTL
jgi:hypothetical protein